MKKNSILKAIGILYLLVLVLSWIIPTGYFNEGKYVADSVVPIGIFDIIIYPLITITSSVFVLIVVDILLIGAFYGVLNKTVAYQNLISSIVKKTKDKKTLVLISTIIFFALFASLTGLPLPLFVFVPLFATILLLLGYNKITAMMSTAGAILVGNMASTYGYDVAGYITYLTNDINNSIIWRFVFLFISVLILIIFATRPNNMAEKADKEEVVLYDKTTKKANTLPLVISLVFMFVITLVGMFNWEEVFKIDFFTNIHNSVVEFKIGGYALFENLLGSMTALGTWTNYQLGLILIVFGVIIGLIYKVKFNDIINGAIEGMKEILPVALMTLAANLIFLLMNVDQNGYSIYATIIGKIIGSKVALVPFGFVTIVGSVLYNDFPYLLGIIYGAVVDMKDQYVLIGFMTQMIHGLVQLIAPTSLILVAGLTYFKIPYTKWLKEMWKYFLCILVIIIVFALFV